MLKFIIFLIFFVSIFCADSSIQSELSPSTQFRVDKINQRLDQFASGEISDLNKIIIDFNELHLQDRLKFYKVILSSRHRFAIPIAFAVPQYKCESTLLMDLQLMVSNFLRCTNPKKFYQIMLELIVDAMKMMNDVVFISGNSRDLQTRVEIADFFSQCLQKLFQIYKEESNTLKICKGGTETFYESENLDEETVISTVKWWRDLFLEPSKDRDLLFHEDIQVSLPKFMADLITKIHANSQYKMEPREYYILSTLIKETLELTPSFYLAILASQNSEMICLFWIIAINYNLEFPFSEASLFPPFNEMAQIVLGNKFFNSQCFFEYDSSNKLSIKSDSLQPFIKEICNKLYKLAFPGVIISHNVISGSSIPKRSEVSLELHNLIKEVNYGLSQIAFRDTSGLQEIIVNLKALYNKDVLEFYKLTLYSPYRFIIPFAFAAILFENPIWQLLDHFIWETPKGSNLIPFYENLFNLIYKTKDLIDRVICSTDNIQTRMEAVKYSSKCFQKLFKIYKSETNTFKIMKEPLGIILNTFYEVKNLKEKHIKIIVKYWEKFLHPNSIERRLLIHPEPQIPLQKYMNDFIDGNWDPNYLIKYREYCILKYLIAKVLESEPNNFLPFLSKQSPKFICLVLYIHFFFSKFSFSGYNFFPLFKDMANKVLNSSLFQEKCLIIYVEKPKVEVSFKEQPVQSFSLKIWKQLYLLAHPGKQSKII
jgi:hypothetical protein